MDVQKLQISLRELVGATLTGGFGEYSPAYGTEPMYDGPLHLRFEDRWLSLRTTNGGDTLVATSQASRPTPLYVATEFGPWQIRALRDHPPTSGILGRVLTGTQPVVAWERVAGVRLVFHDRHLIFCGCCDEDHLLTFSGDRLKAWLAPRRLRLVEWDDIAPHPGFQAT